VGSSRINDENRSRRIFPVLCGTLFIAGLIGCLLFSWFILQDAYKPLLEYTNAKNIQTEYTDEDYCCTETITTFETVDSPEEVYEFYRKEFRFRLKWLPTSRKSGLSYSFSLGCPVGSYLISAVQIGEHTKVTIRLSTHVCI
jgi:hypothetical protein